MLEPNDSHFDLSMGDRCSATAYGWAKKTFASRQNQVGAVLNSEASPFCQVLNFPSGQMAICADGIGTKIEVAERCGIYSTLGYDLAAMVVDDLICSGAEPISLCNILDVDKLDQTIVDELMEGLYKAATEAKITLSGGEIAELGSRIGGYGTKMHFNWGATALGYIPKGRAVFDGKQVAPGDLAIALPSQGFRSNGFTLARSLLAKKFGPLWHEEKVSGSSSTWGEVLLTPCKIYARLLTDLFATSFTPKALCHITGGGIAGNFSRVLQINGCGCDLEELPSPHSSMLQLQKWGSVTDQEAYSHWNMGVAMMMVVQKEEASHVIDYFQKQKINLQVCGQVVSHPKITLKSKGLYGTVIEHRW